MRIKDEFCGYLQVDEDEYAYNVSKSIVTLLPAANNVNERFEYAERIKNRNTDESEFFYGNDGNSRIAIMRKGSIYGDTIGLDVAVKFFAPIIVKACGNAAGFFNMMSEPWEKYHAIEFCGGSLNALYDPSVAREKYKCEDLLKVDGAREIKLRPFDDYTLSTDLLLDGERVNLKLSIRQSSEKQGKDNHESYNLGKLDSFLRFSFEEACDFTTIEKNYRLARKLVAFLTTQNNVFFDQVFLKQRVEGGKIYKTAECRIFDGFENYSNRNSLRVISLGSVWNNISSIIENISNGNILPLLEVLPSENKMVGRISITNVQDLCSAMEASYEQKYGKKRPKDELIEELKSRIKDTITEFLAEHTNIDVYQTTNISSAFDYLNFTLKTRILTLYDENKNVVDTVITRLGSPQIDNDSVGKFTKLRDSKTHAGAFEWGDRAAIYYPLLAMEYSIYLKLAGIPESQIIKMLERVF